MNIIMRTETFAKLFFLVSFSGLLMYAVLAFYTFHTAFTTAFDSERHQTPSLPKLYSRSDNVRLEKTHFSMKYILIWTTPNYIKNVLGEGQDPFVKNNCSYVNCYLTIDKDHLKIYDKEFDVVFLDIGVLRHSLWKTVMPKVRSPKQKYLFHSMRSADETPICNTNFDGYFNWTWSYKIFSDISTPFIEVRDKFGLKVAPSTDIKWLQNTKSLTEKEIENLNLRSKKKAVAWIPERCDSRTNRFEYVNKLQNALKEHGLDLDVYGCFKNKCPAGGCLKAVENDYYFYLAFEPSSSEDFVTEEVLKAYQHNAVPIVKGGADYRRFLPDGSYLNAGPSPVEKVASLIAFSIRNPSVYHSFHQWRNYYTIEKANHDKGLCELCALVNNQELMESETNYEVFRKWWYRDLSERCYPKGAEDGKFVLSYMNESRVPVPKKFKIKE